MITQNEVVIIIIKHISVKHHYQPINQSINKSINQSAFIYLSKLDDIDASSSQTSDLVANMPHY